MMDNTLMPRLPHMERRPSFQSHLIVDISDDDSDDDIAITLQNLQQPPTTVANAPPPNPPRLDEQSYPHHRRNENQPNKRPRLDHATNPVGFDSTSTLVASHLLPQSAIPLRSSQPMGTNASRPAVHDPLNAPQTLLASKNGHGGPLPGRTEPQRSKKPKKEPPSYLDPVWNVRMYRGPGYERYPIVLGTHKEHQDFCDKWEIEDIARRQRKMSRLRKAGMSFDQPLLDCYSDSEDADDLDHRESALDQRCLATILDIFPDISRQFVLDKIRSHPMRINPIEDDDLIALSDSQISHSIISQIADLAEYPKELKPGRAKEDSHDGSGKTITWDKNTPKDLSYLKDGIVLLQREFPYVPTIYIHRLIHEKLSIFDTFCRLQELEAEYHHLGTHERPYRRLYAPRVTLEKKYQVSQMPGAPQRASRINELQAAKQYWYREQSRISVQEEKELAEKLNLEKHRAMGALVECQCCFESEVPLNRVVSCQGDPAHMFCYGCVSSLAESQVGLMKYEMACVDGSGCKAEMSLQGVAKATDIKTFDRLQFNRQQAEIMAAEIEGLEQCPFCEFKAICDSVETEPIFNCQNPDCARPSCRACGLDSHVPKTCEESRKDNDLTVLHRVEEARSDAVMRKCPRCKVKIIKEYGCNKMICSQCKGILCYICQTDLTALAHNAYDHFHKPGSKCPLHDSVGIDRHAQEADTAEEEVIQKAKLEDASLDDSKLRLGQTSTKAPNMQPHPARDIFARAAAIDAGRIRALATARRNISRAQLQQLRRDVPGPILNGAWHHGVLAGIQPQMGYNAFPQALANTNQPPLPEFDRIFDWMDGQNILQQRARQIVVPEAPRQPDIPRPGLPWGGQAEQNVFGYPFEPPNIAINHNMLSAANLANFPNLQNNNTATKDGFEFGNFEGTAFGGLENQFPFPAGDVTGHNVLDFRVRAPGGDGQLGDNFGVNRQSFA